jgi:hypothetical protein
MTTSTISIAVDRESADAFAGASAEQRRKLELLLGLRLRELTSSAGRPLSSIMDDIGAEAVAAGLTEAKLQSLLNDG